MSHISNVPEPAGPVQDDAAKPYKALVAGLVPVVLAILAALQVAPGLPAWAYLLITAVVAGLGTFAVKNPKTLGRATKR